MQNEVFDEFSTMKSTVRFEPTASIKAIAEELRRYGIKTNYQDSGKTPFYQSAHIICRFSEPHGEEAGRPEFSIVSFKDLFHIVGKNPDGADDQDVVRVWFIAEKLENRSMIRIIGTSNQILKSEDRPELPDVYANLHHIHKKDENLKNYSFKSKFSSNKMYQTTMSSKLICIGDYFVLV